VLACKLREFVRLIAGAGAKEPGQVIESNANSSSEWPFKPRAQRVPILFPAQDKSVHPAIALSEHLDEKLF